MNYMIVPGLKSRYILRKEKIINAVSAHFDIQNIDLLKQKNRKRELVTARHFCYHFLRKNTCMSLVSISNYFQQDHTTVLHGVQKIQGFIDIKDEDTLVHISTINGMLNN